MGSNLSWAGGGVGGVGRRTEEVYLLELHVQIAKDYREIK